MAPFSLGVVTLLQGLYSLLWILILVDIGSPTFNVGATPALSGVEMTVAALTIAIIATAVGVAMHTASRNLFRRYKDQWDHQVLTSATVKRRLGAVSRGESIAGGPSLPDVESGGPEAVRRAGEIMHSIDYEVLVRAPTVHQRIQVYREQYRLARAFVLPSIILAMALLLWDPVLDVPAVERLGPFSLIGLQLSLLAVLIGVVSFMAFRERAFRYAAAKVMSYCAVVSADSPGHA